MKKNILMIIGILILIASNAYAIGISDVSPKYLELLPGEYGRFVFQVQAALSKQVLSCSINFHNSDGMLVEFDQQVIEVPAGQVREVLGTITAPQAIAYGRYIENFCVSCSPGTPVAEDSSKVSFNTCGLEINVDVVAERTRENMPLPVKPFSLPVWIAVAITIIAVALILIIAWAYSRRKKKKR